MGVLGGTFDPVHEGHLQLAQKAVSLYTPDGVILAPAGQPPHKENVHASPRQRLKMCRLACDGKPNLYVTDADMREGKPSYTASLMKRLHKEYPDTVFYFIIGADKLPNLHRWHKADELFGLCEFLVCPREGEETVFPDEAVRMGAKFHVMEGVRFPGQSTLIREQLHQDEDAPDLPHCVQDYIAMHGLYREDLLPVLRDMMSAHRFKHTLGVRDMAVTLARRHNAPVMKAALAALLHDCAKGMNTRDLRKIAQEENLTDDEELLSSGAMLHGIVGAHLARTKFGVTDEEVLSAIRVHTMGKPDMTPLELTIFVADAIEENREDYPGLANIRRAAEQSLRCAALLSLRGTRDYVLSQGKQFVGKSYDTMRGLEAQLTQEEQDLINLF